MRTKLRLLLLAPLVLALDITTRDVTAGKDTSTEEGLFSQRNWSENNMNTTEYYRSLEISSDNNDWTAGRTLCRSGHKCGFHQGSAYKYCYVDYSNNWDYCCSGPCDFGTNNYMWCQSGTGWQYCGQGNGIGIDGKSCYYTHQCGVHQEIGAKSYYWCYIDHKLNWRKCCAPWSHCDYNGEPYKWCYAGYTKETDWQYCQ